jgi:hypothetical protein
VPRSRRWQRSGGNSDSPVLLYMKIISGRALCSDLSVPRLPR